MPTSCGRPSFSKAVKLFHIRLASIFADETGVIHMCTLQVLAGIANLLALIPVMVAVVIAIKLRKAIWVALFISEILLVLYALAFTLSFVIP